MGEPRRARAVVDSLPVAVNPFTAGERQASHALREGRRCVQLCRLTTNSFRLGAFQECIKKCGSRLEQLFIRRKTLLRLQLSSPFGGGRASVARYQWQRAHQAKAVPRAAIGGGTETGGVSFRHLGILTNGSGCQPIDRNLPSSCYPPFFPPPPHIVFDTCLEGDSTQTLHMLICAMASFQKNYGDQSTFLSNLSCQSMCVLAIIRA